MGLRAVEASAWALTIAAVGVGIASNHFDLYRRIVWYDEILHLVTAFFLGVLVGARAHRTVFRGTRARLVRRVAVIVTVVLALGLLWELGEWLVDRWRGTTMSKGTKDTAVDLLADLAGALAGALAVSLLATRSRPHRSADARA